MKSAPWPPLMLVNGAFGIVRVDAHERADEERVVVLLAEQEQLGDADALPSSIVRSRSRRTARSRRRCRTGPAWTDDSSVAIAAPLSLRSELLVSTPTLLAPSAWSSTVSVSVPVPPWIVSAAWMRFSVPRSTRARAPAGPRATRACRRRPPRCRGTSARRCAARRSSSCRGRHRGSRR